MNLETAQVHISRFRNVIDRIVFPKFTFLLGHTYSVGADRVGYFYLQISCKDVCNHSGEPMEWTSRKWLMSMFMTDGEIVQTAFKAVLTALEHEAREQFKYRGVSIFDPHYNIDALVALRSDPASIKERPAQ